MCRSCAHGGRRCPGETPAARRARQNAAYHRKVASKQPATPPPTSQPPTTVAGQWTHAVDSQAGVAERINATRAYLDLGEPYTRTNEQGWLVPSEHGQETTAHMRHVGEALNARAEVLAADDLAGIGHDPSLPCQRPGGFATRGEYAEHVSALHAQYTAEIDAVEDRKRRLRVQLRELGDDAQDQRQGLLDQLTAANVDTDTLDAAFEVRKAHSHLQLGDSQWDKVEARIYAAATREALAEQRPMGLPNGSLGTYHHKSHKTALRRLETALDYYPTEWTDKEATFRDEVHLTDGTHLVREFPLIVTSTSGRAFYRRHDYTRDPSGDLAWGSTLRVDTATDGALDEGVSTALHEYGHRAEHVTPEINNVCQAFVAERTMNSDGTRHELREYLANTPSDQLPQNLDAFSGRKNGLELVRPDDFVDQYIGKQNDPRNLHSEVFSMGMEAIFAGRYGGFRGRGNWKADPDHRNLILGVLATIK